MCVRACVCVVVVVVVESKILQVIFYESMNEYKVWLYLFNDISTFVGCLVCLVLWHINLCKLFNAKSIFMKIVLFQTIQSV